LPSGIYDLVYITETGQLDATWKTYREVEKSVLEYGKTDNYGTIVESESTTRTHQVVVEGLKPETTYHFRVATTDETGNKNYTDDHVITMPYVIDIWYGQNQTFGDPGKTQRWANILGKFNPASIISATYSLNGGPTRPLAIGPDGLRLHNPGDFNIELAYPDIDYTEYLTISTAFITGEKFPENVITMNNEDFLQEGKNTLIITAIDKNQNTYPTSMTITYVNDQTWPLPYDVTWSEVSEIQDYVDVVDGHWIVNQKESTVRIAEHGYDRMIALGDISSWKDYEVEVPVTIHKVDLEASGYAHAAVVLRWQGHYTINDRRPRGGWYPLGAFVAYTDWEDKPSLLEMMGNGAARHVRYQEGVEYDVEDRAQIEWDLEMGTTYIFRAQVETVEGGSLYRVKVWEQGTDEPEDWDLMGYGPGRTDYLNPGELKRGSIGLVAYHGDMSFGNVSIRPLEATDKKSKGKDPYIPFVPAPEEVDEPTPTPTEPAYPYPVPR
jgi:hypothetical protein